jgi:hypothetical protein
MLKSRFIWVCLLVPLYLVTEVGGWISHARQLREQTEASYRTAERENREEETAARKLGVKPFLIKLHPDGPKSGVYWCLPVLPGVLLANSYWSVGPLYASGGTKVVLYYGFGSTELCTLVGWAA